MKNERRFDSIIDLSSLQKRADLDGIYRNVSDHVTRMREAMLHAMSRHDMAGIRDLIQTLEEKIAAENYKPISVGHLMSRKQIESACVEAYRHVINIGRTALHSLSGESIGNRPPTEAVRRWDA